MVRVNVVLNNLECHHRGEYGVREERERERKKSDVKKEGYRLRERRGLTGALATVEKMGWPPRRLTERRAVEQGQCFHHCRSFFHSPCRRWTALFCPLPLPLFLCSPRSEPLLPLSFYAFLPAKDPLSSGCRWVYRQPVGISVSARSVVWGMDEFCKSPFFFSRPLPVVRLSPFSTACPGQPLARPGGCARARACVCARRAFKRQKRPLSTSPFLFGQAGAIMCALLSGG